MVKAAYVDKNGVKKGAWSAEEDEKLRSYVLRYGHWNWRLLPKFAGLKRCGKSCRLRWMNYLKSGIKRGNYTREERDLIEKLHYEHGNKWSVIAAKLPGRTDNDIKNFWHTHLRSRETTSKSRQHADISQQKHSSEVGDCKNLENNAFSPKLCSRKLGKSKVSSDELFILESSSSNMASSEVPATVDLDLDSSTDKNFPEMSLSTTSGATDDLLSEFDESFWPWTQPFMVDTYSYKCDYCFSLLDEAIPSSSMF